MYNDKKELFYYIFGCFLAATAFYVLLFGIYRPAEVDDAWTTSYVYNFIHNHTTVGIVFGDIISNIKYFGHIHAYLAGFVADHFGWSKAVFHIFNLICMLAAAIAWFLTAKRLLSSTKLALIFILLIFLMEAFIGAAYKSRSDAFVFLLLAWSVVSAAYARFFLSALLCSLAIEVHAVAGIGIFFILASLASYYIETVCTCVEQRRESSKIQPLLFRLVPLLSCAAGFLCGLIIYKVLHPEPFTEIFGYLMRANSEGSNAFNALSAHYFTREYYRFVPELLFISGGIFLFFYQNSRKVIFSRVSLLCLATILASLVIRRANFHYVIFFYPPLFLLALAGYKRFRFSILKAAIACFALYCIILNSALIYLNRHVDQNNFDVQLADILPEDELPVVGPPNAWFNLREKPFYVNFGALQNMHKNIIQIFYIESIYSEKLPANAKVKENLGEFVFNNTKVRVLRVEFEK